MTSTQRKPYSLLADDNQPMSLEVGMQRALKAHIVLTLAFNESLVFSDNQLVTSPNLRELLKVDGVVRELARLNCFSVAARQGWDDNSKNKIQDLLTTQSQFIVEGKISSDRVNVDQYGELEFAEQHFAKIGWDYRSVREHFTKTSKSVLLTHFSKILTDRNLAIFLEIINEEEQRDMGLGREFLQKRFPHLVMSRLESPPSNSKQLIHDCTEGPYVSNLPKVLGLNPIYASSHSRSFETMRDVKLDSLETAFTVQSKRRLSFEHYIEGLARLDVEDIMWLRDTDDFKEYHSFYGRDLSNEADTRELTTSFYRVNHRVEDRILSRFPELKLSTREAPDQIVRSRWARAEFGGGVLLEVLGAYFNLNMPGAGIGLAIFFAGGEKKFGASEKRIHEYDLAQREAHSRELRYLLEDSDKAQKIGFEVPLLRHFEKETIVRGL